MIFEQLSALIADQFGVDQDSITMDTSFEEDLSADSLDRKSDLWTGGDGRRRPLQDHHGRRFGEPDSKPYRCLISASDQMSETEPRPCGGVLLLSKEKQT